MSRACARGTVEIVRHGESDVIRRMGEHDLATRDAVWGAVERSIEDDRGVVVSLVDADFIDSGTINALYKADKLLQERGRRVAVHVHTASVVRRALEITNVCDSLPCFGDVDAALASASTRGSDSSWNIE